MVPPDPDDELLARTRRLREQSAALVAQARVAAEWSRALREDVQALGAGFFTKGAGGGPLSGLSARAGNGSASRGASFALPQQSE
jgi:hypothetical protein